MITENIIITLPDISFDDKDFSQNLMQLYIRCTLGTRVFPVLIKNAVTFKNDDFEKAQIYFTNLYNYFNIKPIKSEKDYSITSSKPK